MKLFHSVVSWLALVHLLTPPNRVPVNIQISWTSIGNYQSDQETPHLNILDHHYGE